MAKVDIELIEAQAKALAPILRRLVKEAVEEKTSALRQELDDCRRQLAALQPERKVKPHIRLSQTEE